MSAQVIPLYGACSGGGGCGLSANKWSTLPHANADGLACEGTDFVLPDEFEYHRSKFGAFITHRDSGDVMHVAITFDGQPVLNTPDGRRVILERA